jgi:hypothetical protein
MEPDRHRTPKLVLLIENAESPKTEVLDAFQRLRTTANGASYKLFHLRAAPPLRDISERFQSAKLIVVVVHTRAAAELDQAYGVARENSSSDHRAQVIILFEVQVSGSTRLDFEELGCRVLLRPDSEQLRLEVETAEAMGFRLRQTVGRNRARGESTIFREFRSIRRIGSSSS